MPSSASSWGHAIPQLSIECVQETTEISPAYLQPLKEVKNDELLSMGSQRFNHPRRTQVGDGIAIAAKDNSQKGLEQFQRIVRAAFKRQIKEGYKIITHIASGNLYDGMIMYYE